MPLFPDTGLWADVFPRDRLWRHYFWHVVRSTIPFVVIAVFALILDWMTHFPIEIGVTTYEVGGGALGVFLVLRTNSGYERWWDARKLWGGITNQSRSLATAAIAYGANDQWKAEIIGWIALFGHAARRRLRGDLELPEADHLIGTDATATLMTSTHRPVAIALKIADLLNEAAGQLPPPILMQMERDRITLIDNIGGCERILSTPVPQAYTILIRQFLVMFLASFPFGILQKVTWLTPLITLFVAFPMLALDEIGTELQNPFSTDNVNHLPLDKYCQNIEETLMELLADKSPIVHDE